MPTSNFLQITPCMTVEDLPGAVAFFTGILGFTAQIDGPNYAYLEREGVGMRILEGRGQDAAPAGNRRFAYYIDVRDIAGLLAELKPKLDTLPAGEVRGPVDQRWGQRELMVLAPDGNLVVFGQALDPTDTLERH